MTILLPFAVINISFPNTDYKAQAEQYIIIRLSKLLRVTKNSFRSFILFSQVELHYTNVNLWAIAIIIAVDRLLSTRMKA